METSLVLGSRQKPVGVRFRQQLYNVSNNLTVTVDGVLNTSTGAVQAHGTAFKHVVMPHTGGLRRLLDRVDLGASYASDLDEVYGSARAKKAYRFGSGTTRGTLELEGEADMDMAQKVDLRGRVQLSSKVFNFTDNQDMKLTVGYGHKRIGVTSKFTQGVYGSVHENNWSLHTDFKKHWEVTYDL